MEVSGLAVLKPGLSTVCIIASYITKLTVVVNGTKTSPLQLLTMIFVGFLPQNWAVN